MERLGEGSNFSPVPSQTISLIAYVFVVLDTFIVTLMAVFVPLRICHCLKAYFNTLLFVLENAFCSNAIVIFCTNLCIRHILLNCVYIQIVYKINRSVVKVLSR